MIVLMGIKHSGKSTLGAMAAKKLDIPFLDLDHLLEKQYSSDRIYNFRELYKKIGPAKFMNLETAALQNVNMDDDGILALGGGTIENKEAVKTMTKASMIIFLDVEEDVLFERIKEKGFPPFLEEDPARLFHELYVKRKKLYTVSAEIILKLKDDSLENSCSLLVKTIKEKQ